MASNHNRDFIKSHGKSKKVAKNISKDKKSSDSRNLDEIKKSKSELVKQRKEQRKIREKEHYEMIDRIRDSKGKSRNPEKIDNKILEKDLLTYYSNIEKKINQTSDQKKICEFLLSEKKIIEAKGIKANIKKDGYYYIYFQRVLTIILNPLYNTRKTELESKTKLADFKQMSVPENPSKSADIKDQILNVNTKVVEKTKVEGINTPKVDSKLPNGFAQIAIKNITKEKIICYFMILAKEKNNRNNEPYMTEQDVLELVNKNFSVFESKPTGKYFEINLKNGEKIRLRYFMQEFYERFEGNQQGGKMKYVNFLIHNFELFKDDKLITLYKAMGSKKQPVPDNIIPTSKYFS